MIYKIALISLSLFFVLAGFNHFRDPRFYLTMMPPYLPQPELLNYIAGAAEIAGGIGVLFPRFRRAAGWGLLLLLIAVFPANIHVALNGWPGVNLSRTHLWARLPFQLVFMGWVYWVCLRRKAS